MREVVGDLWEIPCDVRVISTNGDVNRFAIAMMGKGCALEAAKKYQDLPRGLGRRVAQSGNHVYHFPDIGLVTFPVKHHWHIDANIPLIQRSAEELVNLVTDEGWQTVVMPRPGCGNGKLLWSQVKPILEPMLDDRFVVVSFPEEQ